MQKGEFDENNYGECWGKKGQFYFICTIMPEILFRELKKGGLNLTFNKKRMG